MNDAAIDLLTNLVAIPSPSEEEAAASVYLAGWMNEHGLTAYVDDAGSAVGIKGDGPKEILLMGHIDTFPGEVPVRREGDLLYGRGAVDAKGPLCTFAAATNQVDVPSGWRITVVGAVEEEAATSKGARFVLSQRRGEESWSSPASRRVLASSPPPVFCVIGEPSHWDRVTLGYKGRLLLDVMLRVPFSHSAGEGRLPAEQAVDLWRQVEQFCAQVNKDRQADTPFNRLDPSLRHIASRDEGAFGVVQLGMGFRLPVGLGLTELEQELRQVVQSLPAGSSAQLQFSGGEPAYKGDKSNPLVRTFLRAIRAAGGEPRFVVKTGTADMNVVAPHWPDTPVVAYGPGDSSLDHTPQEHIDLNEYLRAIGVLQDVLERLMDKGKI
ncbi:MAG: acetyl-lysine deacetylase [Chloroflexota bacterium]|nr:MAG: acetyl-lysine deacetylase [Chloroflexota bacterium]